MKVTLSQVQLAAVINAMGDELNKWKAEKLEHRANHVTSMINDNGGNIDVIRLKQNAIRSIDQEIQQRHNFFDSLVRAINLAVKVKA